MEIIFDSSSLILLAKIEIIQTVTEDTQLIIPERVRIESTKKKFLDGKLILSLIEKNNIKVIRVKKQNTINKLCKDFNIHRGEAEALALAISKNAPLTVDDLPTINACKILNHSFLTAIHFLIDITKRGKLDKEISFVKLEKLSMYGRYKKRIIDDAIIKLRGES